MALEFGVDADRMIGILRSMDIPVRSYLTVLTDDQVARLRARWERERRLTAPEPALPQRRRRAKLDERLPNANLPDEPEPTPRRRRKEIANLKLAELAGELLLSVEDVELLVHSLPFGWTRLNVGRISADDCRTLYHQVRRLLIQPAREPDIQAIREQRVTPPQPLTPASAAFALGLLISDTMRLLELLNIPVDNHRTELTPNAWYRLQALYGLMLSVYGVGPDGASRPIVTWPESLSSLPADANDRLESSTDAEDPSEADTTVSMVAPQDQKTAEQSLDELDRFLDDLELREKTIAETQDATSSRNADVPSDGNSRAGSNHDASSAVVPAERAVFVSYSRKDKAKAALLVSHLLASGFTVWWDHQVLPGQEFERVIRDQLAACACVLVLWSSESIKSDYVFGEAREGKKRGVLVTIAIDAVDITDIPFEFSRVHVEDLSSWSDDPSDPRLVKVLASLKMMLRGRRRDCEECNLWCRCRGHC
ncbi:MAG: TIR domain-containing protein [Gemmatimonadetes bacterium]|nr:TIR domain-containing protein [Gemmatimonadota bacterium]